MTCWSLTELGVLGGGGKSASSSLGFRFFGKYRIREFSFSKSGRISWVIIEIFRQYPTGFLECGKSSGKFETRESASRKSRSQLLGIFAPQNLLLHAFFFTVLLSLVDPNFFLLEEDANA